MAAAEQNSVNYPNTTKVLNDFAKYIVEHYKDNLEEFNHNTITRGLYNSVDVHTVSFDGERMIVSIVLNDYWKFVENGRAAGKMPPVEAIQNWIERRPDLFGMAATQQGVPGHLSSTPSPGSASQTSPLAWAIAKNIAKEGTDTTPSPVLATTMKEAMEVFRHQITEALAKDLSSMFNQVVASVWVDRDISKVDGKWVDLEVRDTMVL